MTTLLQEFIREECTPYVRGLLEEALASPTASAQKFEFNRFEITLEKDDGMVLLEDVLDATNAGAERVAMSEFAHALKASAT